MKVQCIDDKGISLTLMKIYEAVEVSKNWYEIRDAAGMPHIYSAARFIEVEEGKNYEVSVCKQ